MTDSEKPYHKPASYTVPFFLNGYPLTPSTIDISTQPITILTPPNLTPAWHFHPVPPSLLPTAISTASTAYKSWSLTSLSHRVSIFQTAARIVEDRSEEICYYIKKEIGADEAFARFNIWLVLEALRGVSEGLLKGVLEGEVVEDIGNGRVGRVERVPFGVVAAIAPWNAPFFLSLRSILAPIAAGNTTILLSSPLSPQTHYTLATILTSAGLPSGVLTILPSSPNPTQAADLVETLLSHRDVKFLNFTGSTAVGRRIGEVAGRYGKKVVMELGGKCVALILDDGGDEEELGKMAEKVVIGAYMNSGQICMSTEIVLIPHDLTPRFKHHLHSQTQKIYPSPVPLITPTSVAKLTHLLTDAISKGAILEYGEVPSLPPLDTSNTDSNDSNPTNTAISPILLSNVTREMEIFTTETFAPVLCLVEYEDGKVQDAVDVINSLEYGLSVSVLTAEKNGVVEAEEVAGKIESGAVHINHMTVYDHPMFPHGGVNASGYGRFGGRWGLEEFTWVKTVTRPIA